MIHKTQKFNMKSEGRAYREIYAFYYFCPFLEKVIKKLLTFCYWGKLLIYINNKDNNAIRKDVENLNKTQIENINMLRYLREKSDMYNKGFLMSITALSVIDRINFLFDLCKVRAEKLS